MLTTVILEGAMGKQFGRKWELEPCSPAEALRIIDANKPGMFAWIKGNLQKYGRYRVICEYPDGRKDELDGDTFAMNGKPSKIRFVPLIEGASAAARFVVGAILLIIAYVFPPSAPYLAPIGAGLMIGSAIEMLSPRPKNDTDSGERKDKTSRYFDGPVNTSMQGVPVPLIYGRVLTGSHAISASLTIE
jgi:predicted phage tail protein